MSSFTVRHITFVTVVVSWISFAHPAMATPFFFSTGTPDGLIATLSRTASPGKLETETADDFVTTAGQTVITNATSLFTAGETADTEQLLCDTHSACRDAGDLPASDSSPVPRAVRADESQQRAGALIE